MTLNGHKKILLSSILYFPECFAHIRDQCRAR